MPVATGPQGRPAVSPAPVGLLNAPPIAPPVHARDVAGDAAGVAAPESEVDALPIATPVTTSPGAGNVCTVPVASPPSRLHGKDSRAALSAGVHMPAVLGRLHRTYAHPGAARLLHLPKKAGCVDAAVASGLQRVTDSCAVFRGTRARPPRVTVTLPRTAAFNDTVALDLAELTCLGHAVADAAPTLPGLTSPSTAVALVVLGVAATGPSLTVPARILAAGEALVAADDAGPPTEGSSGGMAHACSKRDEGWGALVAHSILVTRREQRLLAEVSAADAGPEFDAAKDAELLAWMAQRAYVEVPFTGQRTLSMRLVLTVKPPALPGLHPRPKARLCVRAPPTPGHSQLFCCRGFQPPAVSSHGAGHGRRRWASSGGDLWDGAARTRFCGLSCPLRFPHVVVGDGVQGGTGVHRGPPRPLPAGHPRLRHVAARIPAAGGRPYQAHGGWSSSGGGVVRLAASAPLSLCLQGGVMWRCGLRWTRSLFLLLPDRRRHCYPSRSMGSSPLGTPRRSGTVMRVQGIRGSVNAV